MELKEGMYVRTKYNDFCNCVVIRKIDEIDEDDNKFWIDEYVFDTYGDEQNKICEEDVQKASFNIIDLIEVGDYVNGHLVIDKYNDNDDYGRDFTNITLEDSSLLNKGIIESEIKSIVTKEQFESMKYEVE